MPNAFSISSAARPSARPGRRRAKIAEQRRVDEAAFNEIEFGGDAKAAGHFETGRDRRDQIGARELTAQLSCRDRGGNGRNARVKRGGVMRVVMVARIGHAGIDPSRVMGGEFSAQEVKLSRGATDWPWRLLPERHRQLVWSS